MHCVQCRVSFSLLHQRSLQVELPLKYMQKQKGLCERGQGLTDWHWNTVCSSFVGTLETAYLQRQNTWEQNRCRLSDCDLSCCVEPIPIGSKEQTTLANHQSTIHCPLFPPRTSDPTASRKRRSLASRKRPTVLTVKWSDHLVVLCAARTVDGGRSSEMTARLP
jgi:hypothetical protein